MEIFRGEDKGEQVIRSGFKADWRLVPKEDEESFLNRQYEKRPVNEVPTHINFPPLFEHFLVEGLKKSGQAVSEPPMMPLIIQKGSENRAIQEGETTFLDSSAS